jgi:DNA-binding CsgD family transcriptional regulator
MPPGAAENNKLEHIKILNEKDWIRFREWFEQYIPGLYQHLKDRSPSLTSAEIRLFMLIKLNFDTLEVSEALGISKESVWRSRHRLSQKLGLEETKDLDGFVVGFSIP